MNVKFSKIISNERFYIRCILKKILTSYIYTHIYARIYMRKYGIFVKFY